MRRLAITVTAFCALAATTPARAFGDLQNCDAIKDAGERMTCLYAHIAHLEQTLLSFSTDITDLRRALKEKLDANSVYKLQYVGKGTCLGYADSDKPPVFRVATAPNSWKLARGSQSPKGAVDGTPSPGKPDKAEGKGRARARKSPRTRRRMNPKPMLSLRPRLSLSPYPKPQPSLKPRLSLRRTRSIQTRGSSRGPACPR